MAKSGGGSPNQVLIIFLVFFVLATIVLGVTTFLGYDGQNALTQAAKKEQTDARKKEADADWYRYQALFFRQIMGEKLNDDDKKQYTVLRDKFATDELQKNTSDPRKADAEKTITAALNTPELFNQDRDPTKSAEREKEPRKDMMEQAKKDLLKSYPEVVKDKVKAADTLVATDLKNAKDAAKEAATKLQAAEASLAAEKKRFETALKKVETDATAAVQGKFDDTKRLQESVDTMSAELAKIKEDIGALDVDKAKVVAALTKQLEDLKLTVKQLEDERKVTVNIFDYDQAKGKIVEMDRTGEMPFINLGSDHNLKQGVTFSVYSLGTNGKPEREAKATVEVFAVLGPRQSQVRVTSLRDGKADPIVKGDLLFNPGWDPFKQQHVAVAGYINLSGDDRDELNELLRLMDKNRIVVDSYQDSREIAIKGEGITRKTDFLILGDEPPLRGSVAFKDDDPRAKLRQDLLDLRTKMQKEAELNGVTIISLKKFLLLSGISIPRANMRSDGASSTPVAPLKPDAPKDPPAPPK